MADVLVKPAFVSLVADSGDVTKLGPTAWNAARLFSGGSDGEIVVRSAASATGAAWSASLGALTAASLAVTAAVTVAKASAAESKNVAVFQTNEALSGDFYIGIGSTLNPFGTRYDQVLTWGYNQVPGAGNRYLTTEHALAWRIENCFTPNGSTQATEAHLTYISRSGTVYRPWTYYADLNTDNTDIGFNADSFTLSRRNGTNQLLMLDAEIRVMGSTTLFRHDTNNVQWLQQKNAANNNWIRMMYVDNADYVVIGGALAAGVRWGITSIAIGTGSAAVPGAVGGTGRPQTAAQNGWLPLRDSTGVAIWIPIWK